MSALSFVGHFMARSLQHLMRRACSSIQLLASCVRADAIPIPHQGPA